MKNDLFIWIKNVLIINLGSELIKQQLKKKLKIEK